MISHVETDLEEMFTFVKDFTYTMTMASVPPAGNVIVVREKGFHYSFVLKKRRFFITFQQ